MIIRTTDASLLLITQPDHAMLAGRIMERWQVDGLTDSPRRAEILSAVAGHDNGWREVDTAPVVDPSGKLLDFVTAPLAMRQGVWPRGVERLGAQPYTAALVAAHALHVYDRNRGHVDWDSFFDEMRALRDRYLAATGVPLDDLNRDYTFVRIGDLISLTFCNAWQRPQADAFGYEIHFDGTRLTIAPDPFRGAEIPVEIAARELPNRVYTSAEDAEQAWRSASVLSVATVISGQ